MASERHLPYEITQYYCIYYLPLNAGKRTGF